MQWSQLLGCVAVAVALLDALEYQFPATRAVHEVHNFPDILGMAPPKNHCVGTLLAGLSGVVAAALPLLLAWMVFASTSRPSDEAVKLQAAACVFLVAVVLYAATSRTSVFFVHRCMYATLALSLLAGWVLSCCAADR